MAKIQVVGNAVVFSSKMSLEDLETIKKYRPKALSVFGGDDGDELEFTVAVAPGCMGDVNSNLVIFGMETHDENKVAAVTKLLDASIPTDELKEVLADKLGAALNYMNKLEETLPAVLEEVKAERAAVMEAIEVA